MPIKKHKLFGLREGWPWWLVNLIATAAVAKAIIYNYVSTDAGIPVPGWVTMMVTLAGFYGLTIYRYIRRYQWIKSIRCYTKHGVAIIIDGETTDAKIRSLGWEMLLRRIEKTYDDATVFWTSWAMHLAYDRSAVQQMFESFNGGVLVITDRPILLRSSSGPMPAGTPERALGISHLDQIAVVWDGDRVKTYVDLLGLIRHEIGHQCLSQLGIAAGPNGGEAHHDVFTKTKYGA